MCDKHRRAFVRGTLFALVGVATAATFSGATAQAPAAPAPKGKWVCPPCGCAADGKEFDAPGLCPECGMPLIPKAAEKSDKPQPASPSAPKPEVPSKGGANSG